MESNQNQNKTNTKAIISLILGILSLFSSYLGIAAAVGGIILSKLANKEIAETKEQGEGLAKAGFITSVIGIIILVLDIIITGIFATIIGTGFWY